MFDKKRTNRIQDKVLAINALNLEHDDIDQVRKLLEFRYFGNVALFQIGLSNARAIYQQPSMMAASTVISYRFEALI